MHVLMVGRRPSVALKELNKFWGHVEFVKAPYIKLGKFDLVIAQEPTFRVGPPSLIIAKLSRSVFICEVHGEYLTSNLFPLKDRLIAPFILKRADFVRAVNRRLSVKLLHLGLRKVVTIPSVYIKLDLFKPLTDVRYRKPIVMSAGRLTKEKRFDLLINAFSIVSKQVPEAKLRILGQGPELPYLKALVKNLKLEGSVILEGLWVSQQELVKHYNESAVFVCSSIYEGGPRTVFEAAACMTPSVSTPVGIVPEVLKDGRSFLLTRNDSPETIADRILELLLNPLRREEVALEARNIVVKEFEWNKAVRRYAEAYIKLAEELKS